MRNDIIIAALRKEMESAEKRLRSAFWQVGRTENYERVREAVDVAVAKLTNAASYYDAVKAELTRLEGTSEADSLDVQRELAPECAV